MANFFASEIRKAKIVGASNQFWSHLFTSMGAGKIFLAVDYADTGGKGWSHINNIVPGNITKVISDQEVSMSCPDSKASVLALETELDHRPKKNGSNYVLAGIT